MNRFEGIVSFMEIYDRLEDGSMKGATFRLKDDAVSVLKGDTRSEDTIYYDAVFYNALNAVLQENEYNLNLNVDKNWFLVYFTVSQEAEETAYLDDALTAYCNSLIKDKGYKVIEAFVYVNEKEKIIDFELEPMDEE